MGIQQNVARVIEEGIKFKILYFIIIHMKCGIIIHSQEVDSLVFDPVFSLGSFFRFCS